MRRGVRATALCLVFLGSGVLLSEEHEAESATEPRQEAVAAQPKPESEPGHTTFFEDDVALRDSPSAVFVLTGEELRRLGVHTLPEAFRYVPGMSAFQLNGFTYAVGIRGVEDEFNPRLHVYLDGRLVNVAEFGGVDWESIPVSVDDIDRIEVTRAVGIPGEAGLSPGGVVRIWSRKPSETHEGTYSGYVATQENVIQFGRVSGSWGPLSGKIALEYRRDDGIAGTTTSGGVPSRRLNDDQDLLKFNVEGIWEIVESATFDVHFSGVAGRIEESSADPISNGRTDTRNMTVSAVYRHIFEELVTLQAGYYYEDFSLKVLDYPGAPLHAAGDDIDLDRTTNALFAAARITPFDIWDIHVGGGWKEDRLFFERNEPTRDDQELYHLHVGTEVRIAEQVLLSGGLQIERDLLAGIDFSPSAGVVYRVDPEHSLRFSYRVGRRKPNFSEARIAFVVPNPTPPPPTLPLFTGNRDLDRETVDAFEVGYRGRVPDIGLLIDVQAYLHELDDKIVFVPDPTSPLPAAMTFDNAGEERAHGVELYADWQVKQWLSAYATYTFHYVENTDTDRRRRDQPQHTANAGVRLRIDEGPLEGLSALINLNFVSEIEQTDANGVDHEIDDRFRLDFRIAKTFLDDRVEAAFIARNILDNETLEFRPALGSNAMGDFGAERTFFFNLLIRL